MVLIFITSFLIVSISLFFYSQLQTHTENQSVATQTALEASIMAALATATDNARSINTSLPPTTTFTQLPPTQTPLLPTATFTQLPPTQTPLSPTATFTTPPTQTPLSPTATFTTPPTQTPLPPTATFTMLPTKTPSLPPRHTVPPQIQSTSTMGTFVSPNRPLPVTVTRPRSLQQGLNFSSVWSTLEFQDIASPGIATYELTVNSAQTYRWVFTWCGSDTVSLDTVLQPLASVEFRVDGSPINSILEYSVPECRGWITLLSDWPTGETVSLEIVYVLSDELFDGIRHYSPGRYVQQIAVTAR